MYYSDYIMYLIPTTYCKVKVKVTQLQSMKSHSDVNARDHIFAAAAPGRDRVASPTLDRLYHQGKPPVSFYRRLSGFQDQSGQEGAKKNFHLPTPGIEPWPSSP